MTLRNNYATLSLHYYMKNTIITNLPLLLESLLDETLLRFFSLSRPRSFFSAFRRFGSDVLVRLVLRLPALETMTPSVNTVTKHFLLLHITMLKIKFSKNKRR